MAEEKPAIIIITGAWHLPESWDYVKTRLEKAGYEVHVPGMLTVRGPDPVTHTWRVDMGVVHDTAMPIVDRGGRVVLVGHSYGGCVATISTQCQTVKERTERGLPGGLVAVVYVSAFPISKKGNSAMSTAGVYGSWVMAAELFKGQCYSINVRPEMQLSYNDLPPDEAKFWAERLCYHSQRSLEELLPFCANDISILMIYLLCEADINVPIQAQDCMVSQIPKMKTERCTAGHSPFLSQPDRTVEVVIKASRQVR
ncbi:hypothetical protein JX265_010203 [Neoarthrinium moseri]|uniref:AB hydrolase-1 domain-containing protein n=1 Tax=Neoarthrinium moseri TaxID=1658444 RepID=A0A9Q0AIK2_9PEZI|nr:hypothetical protein JX265_010203 [Neoarthrinium moseri]